MLSVSLKKKGGKCVIIKLKRCQYYKRLKAGYRSILLCIVVLHRNCYIILKQLGKKYAFTVRHKNPIKRRFI